jgi:ABC-type sugar transport system permease subunit
MAPCVMLVLEFLLYSVIDEIYLSLTRWSLLTTPSSIFVGLSPYGQPFADGVFWASLGRSCI